jgi:hypothetical protein
VGVPRHFVSFVPTWWLPVIRAIRVFMSFTSLCICAIRVSVVVTCYSCSSCHSCLCVISASLRVIWLFVPFVFNCAKPPQESLCAPSELIYSTSHGSLHPVLSIIGNNRYLVGCNLSWPAPIHHLSDIINISAHSD